MAKQRKKQWSFNAGQRGRNWVRAFQDSRDRKFWVEWREQTIDPVTGAPEFVRNYHGVLVPKMWKRRLLLQNVTDPDVARERAETIAAEFAELPTTGAQDAKLPVAADAAADGAGILTAGLIDCYLEEVTPTKGVSKQDHDRRAARIFKHSFRSVPAARLDRTHWDAFIAARRDGRIPGFEPVQSRQVIYDLKFLIAVLTWGLGAADEHGEAYLQRSPWSAERRKALGMRMPKGGLPRRPAMTDEIREGLIRFSPNVQFEVALLLGSSTVSRNGSVRHLKWSDINLFNGTVCWRGEFDKNGHEVLVPLPPTAIEALRSLPRGVGDAWVFPSATDPSVPTPRDTFQTWLRRAKSWFLASIDDPGERAGLETRMRGLGFHAEKRAGVRDTRFRNLPPKIQEAIARTNHETLRKIYDDVDVDEIAAAMRQQGLLHDGEDDQLAAARWQQKKK